VFLIMIFNPELELILMSLLKCLAAFFLLWPKSGITANKLSTASNNVISRYVL